MSGNSYSVSADRIRPIIIGHKRAISRNRGHERGHVKYRDRGQEFPIRQRRDRGVRTFRVLVRRRLV